MQKMDAELEIFSQNLIFLLWFNIFLRSDLNTSSFEFQPSKNQLLSILVPIYVIQNKTPKISSIAYYSRAAV